MRPNFSGTTVPTVQIVEREVLPSVRKKERASFDGRKPAGLQIWRAVIGWQLGRGRGWT